MTRLDVSCPRYADTDYICIATDSLAKMMSEHQLLEASNQRLTLAMAAAGHDLRQQLHMLLGTVELLTSLDNEVRCAELSQRAKSLIFRLVGELEHLVSQAQRERNRTVDSTQSFVISNLLGQLKSDWELEAAGKCLRFSVDRPNYLVESDQHLLKVIMNNLVGNAVQHTPEGGVTITSSLEGPFVILAVSDTGPGISDEDLRRSFGFSARSGRQHAGMGLGLSIARKSAELLGHEFQVSRVENGGTCVRLFVPLAKQICI